MAVYDIVKRKLGMYLWEPRMHEETSENIHKQLLYICASTKLHTCVCMCSQVVELSLAIHHQNNYSLMFMQPSPFQYPWFV